MRTKTETASAGKGKPAEAAHLEQKLAVDQTTVGKTSASLGPPQYSRAVDSMIAQLGDLHADDLTRLAGALAGLIVADEADLNPQRAAAKARVAAGTMREWCGRGLLGRKVRGRWRIRSGELRALISGARP